MIELDCVRKQFGPVRAVDGVTLNVEPGECLGFLGPNGAGKTTTIRMITGLLRPSSGRITIGGDDIVRRPRQAKQRIGYIPDRPHLYDKLTGREFVRFVGELYGMSRAEIERRCDAMFERFSLRDVADALLESYSHGMRQKAVLTAALIHEPQALIVDEPMVGLDPKSMRLVKDLLRTVSRERGMAVFLSTHSLDVAEEVCDRIAIVTRGRVIASGTLDELRQDARAESDLEAIFLRLTEEAESAGGG